MGAITFHTVVAASREVERVLGRLGSRTQKRVAVEVGLGEQQMRAKLKGQTDHFTIDQLAQIANALNGPAGWPWVPWEEGALLGAFARLRSPIDGQ